MKTFLAIYVGSQVVILGAWFLAMFFTPVKKRILGYSRFRQNWVEGGQFMLLLCFIVSLILSFGVSRMVLWFNFLER